MLADLFLHKACCVDLLPNVRVRCVAWQCSPIWNFVTESYDQAACGVGSRIEDGKVVMDL